MNFGSGLGFIRRGALLAAPIPFAVCCVLATGCSSSGNSTGADATGGSGNAAAGQPAATGGAVTAVGGSAAGGSPSGGSGTTDGTDGGAAPSGGSAAVGGTDDTSNTGGTSGSTNAGGSSAGGTAAGGSSGAAGASSPGGATSAGGSSDSGPPKKFTNNGMACGSSATWNNPTKQGVADPSMAKQGSTYYVFGTGGGWSTSTDLVTFMRGGSLFPNGLPSWTSYLSGPGLWAPDVHGVNGKYYAYYSISVWGNYNSSVGLATATTMDGPWTDQGMVVDYKTAGNSGVNVIDPDLFVDDDGSWWLSYGSYKSGLRLIELDPASGKAKGNPPAVTKITGSLGEGSDLIKHNGYYYFFASRGKCCAGLSSTYQVVMGRSKTVKGPYVGKNGEQWLSSQYTVFLTGDADHPGVGGQSFFRDTDGQLKMVYMAYTAPSGNSILNVRPMWFDANDWPTLDPCTAATY